MPTSIFILTGIVGVALLVVTFVTRNASASREWRILAFFSFCAFPVLFLVSTLQASFHHMKQVEFCGSCHVMENYVTSLTYDDDEPLASVHYRNNLVPHETACYACHTSYAMFGGVQAKMNGLRHVWANLTRGDEIEEIELYKPYSNDNCLHCHGPAERYREASKHQETEDFFTRVESNELSCLKAGCHDLAHYWETEGDGDDDDDW